MRVIPLEYSNMEDSNLVMDIIKQDLPATLKHLQNLPQSIDDTNSFVQSLIRKISSNDFNISGGIGFLTMKYNVLLNYIIDLALVMLAKVKGNSLEKNYAVERLVENRTIWEKIQPIDQKLRYQIDKVVQSAITGLEGDNPLKYRARPGRMRSKLKEKADESEDEEGNKKRNVYIPPKLAATHNEAYLTAKERKEKLINRVRKRALGSSLLKDLKREYDDAPEELGKSQNLLHLKDTSATMERIDYEEDNFVRLPITKKEKATSKAMSTMASIGKLAHFENISALYDEMEMGQPKKKKGKFTQKKGKGKKKGKKKGKW